jgi:3-deoxy-D-manno-octulosonate 8-phosphate phosphatase KdsC-like HAD superfamily phosphatase
MTDINDFWARLGSPDLRKKSDAVIFDVDGTLADVSKLRREWLYSADYKMDFQGFHAASLDAPVIPWVREAASQAHAQGIAVVIITGRASRWRHHTAWWLALNNVPSDALLMRANNDNRHDNLVKTKMLNQIQLSWRPIWVFDDNPSTISVWKNADIPVTVVPGWKAF